MVVLMLDEAIEILDRLVGFPSISGNPNTDIVGYIKDYLENQNLDVTLSFDETEERANIFTTIGPKIDGGILLNGHTDVVPVKGQNWSTDPFRLTKKDERLYGRGSVDMKGFLACVLASVKTFKSSGLKKPVHLAFTFDEETGGFGMPPLLNQLSLERFRPEIVIVGEPTEMDIVTSHKGGDEMRTEIRGFEVHSCNPNKGVNAISTAMQLIAKIEEIGKRLADKPHANSPFAPPYSTFNVGTIDGGAARNATAGWCNFDWEYRPMPGENSRAIILEIEEFAENILLPPMKLIAPSAEIKIITEISVPAFDDELSEKAASFVAEITGKNSRSVVSFGTDAGYFSKAEYSTVVCGPGTISRAHAPNEYITTDELVQGLNFMNSISKKLTNL